MHTWSDVGRPLIREQWINVGGQVRARRGTQIRVPVTTSVSRARPPHPRAVLVDVGHLERL